MFFLLKNYSLNECIHSMNTKPLKTVIKNCNCVLNTDGTCVFLVKVVNNFYRI